MEDSSKTWFMATSLGDTFIEVVATCESSIPSIKYLVLRGRRAGQMVWFLLGAEGIGMQEVCHAL